MISEFLNVPIGLCLWDWMLLTHNFEGLSDNRNFDIHGFDTRNFDGCGHDHDPQKPDWTIKVFLGFVNIFWLIINQILV